ncbi:hypothetical protein F4679DRAFT_571178 [Xylaria curta]|nr:hypothetical protein F4679DRAFT_571178 [Xylaria curta]
MLERSQSLYKYYQPWLDFKELNYVPIDTGPASDQGQLARCSPDATLTAFAQLAALRLNVKRSMAPLLETQTLAEATQTLSLVDETRHAPGDHIWLGNVSLPRKDCMDEHTLGAITVPIVSKPGHSIGVYAVSDTRPRPEDMSQIIAAHLERVMGSMGRVSDRDFMRGISYFLEELSEYKYRIGNTDLPTRGLNPITPPRGRPSQPGGNPSKKHVRQIFVQASQLLCEQTKATGCVFVDAASGLFTDQDLFNANFGDRSDEMADVLSLSLAEGDGEELCSGGIIKRKGLKNCIIRYPFGKCFYLNQGRVIANNSLAFDEVVTGGGPTKALGVKARGFKDQSHLTLPQEVLKHIPKAKWLIFLPLFNYSRGQWCAASFIWGNDFKMGDPDDASPYFKTFGSCMMSEVASMDVLNTNVAKSTFIVSIFHDLRSPLYGLLGNLEFLEGTLTSAYQTSLVGAIETRGKTPLDTIDHLLDYAKTNNLKGTSSFPRERHIGATSEQASPSTSFDLAVLLEEVVEAVLAGQTFREMKIRQRDPVDQAREDIASISLDDKTPLGEQVHQSSAKSIEKVSLILNIEKTSWFVQGQIGALRQVIMNVVGNAIKYCISGFIEVSLKAIRTQSFNIDAELNIIDTSIGMSDEFLTNHLFKHFSQEDSFASGTGLGLSITSQIVSNLHGKITIASKKNVGTHVNITIPMEVALLPSNMDEQRDIRDAIELGIGKKVCILHPVFSDTISYDPQLSKLESSVGILFQEWFGMEVLKKKCSDREEKGLQAVDAALLVICTNAFEAAALQAAGIKELSSLGKVIEVISQPVGIRKLAKVLVQYIIQRVQGGKRKEDKAVSSKSPSPTFPSLELQKRATEITLNTSPVVYDQVATRYRPSIETLKWKSETLKLPRRSYRPRVLVVDDNAVNLKLLVTFIKKLNLSYAEATNGLEAVTKFKEVDMLFDVVLMDLQMPVMDGLEATREIREYEQKNLMERSRIVAITGVGNDETRQEAMDAGMSEYLTKPVRLKVLQQILLER